MPTPNAMPKKSSAIGSVLHEVRSSYNYHDDVRTFWCPCSPMDSSQGVLDIERHVQAKTGRAVLVGSAVRKTKQA